MYVELLSLVMHNSVFVCSIKKIRSMLYYDDIFYAILHYIQNISNISLYLFYTELYMIHENRLKLLKYY